MRGQEKGIFPSTRSHYTAFDCSNSGSVYIGLAPRLPVDQLLLLGAVQIHAAQINSDPEPSRPANNHRVEEPCQCRNQLI
jgi:hypothetical protein